MPWRWIGQAMIADVLDFHAAVATHGVIFHAVIEPGRGKLLKRKSWLNKLILSLSR